MATTAEQSLPRSRPETVLPPAVGAFASLAYPGIRLILFGTFFAFSGFWAFNIAQGWVVLEITNSAFMVGIVAACSNLPFLFVSLFAGVLADRVDRKKVSLASRATVVAMMVTEAILVWTGVIHIWMMILLALGAGIGFSVDNPVRQSMVPDLVPEHHLGNAVALTFAFNNLTNIVGPSVGGALLALAGPGWSFFATAAGNAVLFTSYLLLRLPPRNPPTEVSPLVQLTRIVTRTSLFVVVFIF